MINGIIHTIIAQRKLFNSENFFGRRTRVDLTSNLIFLSTSTSSQKIKDFYSVIEFKLINLRACKTFKIQIYE